jgi:hypothetical protein
MCGVEAGCRGRVRAALVAGGVEATSGRALVRACLTTTGTRIDGSVAAVGW